MCAVSAITDFYKEKWPLPQYPVDNVYPITITITWEQWNEYQELKRRMAEYDSKTGQPDCVKPDVETWEEAIKKTYLVIPEGED